MIRRTFDYGFGAEFNIPFEDAVGWIKSNLEDEGFQILGEMDLKKAFEDLGKSSSKYTILVACDPQLTYSALQTGPDETRPEVGLLLPVTLVIYESDGKCIVETENPEVITKFEDILELDPIPEEEREKLERAIDKLALQERKAA